jgi:hypothetical protein
MTTTPKGADDFPALAAGDPAAALAKCASVIRSPDFDAYASGDLDISQVRCALCTHAPCDCPPFGTPQYFALIDKRHGRTP